MIDELSDKQLRAAFNEWLTNGTSMDESLGLTKARHNYYQQQRRGASRFARIQSLMETNHYSLRTACYVIADEQGLNGNTIYRSILKYMES